MEFTTDAEAIEAINKFNNYELDGRKMVVNEARPQENRDRAGGGGNSRYDNKRSW